MARTRSWRIPSLMDFNPVVVGVVSLALIATAVGATFAIGTLGIFDKTYTVNAVFDGTGGIKTGRDVRLAGVRVGKVTAVTPDFHAGQVVVTMDIDSGIRLGSHATAEIAISTLLGGLYVRVGGPVAPPFLEDLPAADRRIPLERTRTPATILDALGAITKTASTLDYDTINRVLVQVAGATGRNQDQVGTLLTGIDQLTATLSARDSEFRSLVAHSQDLTGALAARDEQIAELVDLASGLLAKVSEQRDQLAVLLGSSNRAVTQLSDLLAGQQSVIGSLVAQVHTTVGALDQERDAFNTLLAWMGPTINAFGKVGHDGNIDVVGVGLNPDAVGLLQTLLGALGGPP